MQNTPKPLLARWVAGVPALLVATAWAQDVGAPDGVLEQVLVTAQKREESIQDIPIAVTAFSGDAMKALGFEDSIQLAAQTPGLAAAKIFGEGNIPTISIRGVALADTSEHNESPSAIYVDEFYKANLSGLDFQLFDLERAEVLKGPQGTLFGRNATGGLIHYITVKPKHEPEGYAELTSGQRGKFRAEGAVGGGLTDTVAARFSGVYSTHDGYYRNDYPGGEDGNQLDLWGLRGQLLFDPTENLSILLQVGAGENSNDGGNSWQHQGAAPDPVTGLSTKAPTDFFGYADPNDDALNVNSNRASRLETQLRSALLRIDWDVAAMTFTSITGYEQVEKEFRGDPDASPNDLIATFFEPKGDEFSQELRLRGDTERSRWVGGLYYMNYQNDGHQGGDIVVAGVVQDVTWDMNTDTWAIFGQYEYDLNEHWTAVLGLRYNEENKDMETTWNTLVPGVGLVSSARFDEATVGDLAEFDNSNISYNVGINFTPTDDLLFYGATARAFKAGTFNLGVFALTDADGNFAPQRVPVDEEKLTSYEIGFKATLFEGSSRLNGAFFYYDYADYQAFLFDSSSLTNVLFNNDAEIAGAELELITTPAAGWDVVFGISYLDAKVLDVADKANLVGGIPTVKDREMPLAPELSLNGLVRYTFESPWGGRIAIQGDVTYADSQYFDVLESPALEEDSSAIGNVRVSWDSADDHWSIAAYIQNVTNEDHRTYSTDLGDAFGTLLDVRAMPRWFSASVRYRW